MEVHRSPDDSSSDGDDDDDKKMLSQKLLSRLETSIRTNNQRSSTILSFSRSSRISASLPNPSRPLSAGESFAARSYNLHYTRDSNLWFVPLLHTVDIAGSFEHGLSVDEGTGWLDGRKLSTKRFYTAGSQVFIIFLKIQSSRDRLG